MNKRFRIVLGAAIVAGLMAVAPSASAYSTAKLERSQPIAVYPAPDANTCQTRTITLAGYWYEWRNFMQGQTINYNGQSPRDIYLVGDTYTWKVCLYYGGTKGVYDEFSYLDRGNSNVATLDDPDVFFDNVPEGATALTVDWGSQLVPLHA
ncbi:hypothetical protein OG900_38970 [Streptomyces sp. NBC_00433]